MGITAEKIPLVIESNAHSFSVFPFLESKVIANSISGGSESFVCSFTYTCLLLFNWIRELSLPRPVVSLLVCWSGIRASFWSTFVHNSGVPLEIRTRYRPVLTEDTVVSPQISETQWPPSPRSGHPHLCPQLVVVFSVYSGVGGGGKYHCSCGQVY